VKTKGVTLIAVDASHSEAIQTLASNPAIGATSYVPSPYPADGARVWIAETVAKRVAGTEYSFVVAIGGETVGVCSLLGVGGHPKRASLGYWIGRPFWGNGYATDATSQILRFAFEDLAVNELDACCLASNRASRRVIEKTGFRFSHSKKETDPRWGGDHFRHYFTLSKLEWQRHMATGGGA